MAESKTKRTLRKGVETIHPEVLEGQTPVPIHSPEIDHLVENPEPGMTREDMINRIRNKSESEKTEPIPLEGMLGIGTPIDFGEVILYVPPLKIKQLPLALKLIEETQLANPEDPESRMSQINATIKIIHMALKRNYPNMTLEDVEDIIDLATMEEALETVLHLSRITTKN